MNVCLRGSSVSTYSLPSSFMAANRTAPLIALISVTSCGVAFVRGPF